MKLQINKLMTGLAGEYMVAGMMNLKGWVASLTLKNYPSVDIFGMNPTLNGKTVNIQVKSSWESSFIIGVKHSDRDRMDEKIKGPFVFVHCENNLNGKEKVSFYILSKKQLIDLVNKSDDAYYNRPRVKPLKNDYPIALSIKNDLHPYEDKWDSLWLD
ncbi:MAG: hypothetical protein IKQ76_01265 [Bacteroidales bacterium]|nr:hypothetical protein [Bacteroidales bacterium]